jgi:hypothetical protein
MCARGAELTKTPTAAEWTRQRSAVTVCLARQAKKGDADTNEGTNTNEALRLCSFFRFCPRPFSWPDWVRGNDETKDVLSRRRGQLQAEESRSSVVSLPQDDRAFVMTALF